MSNKLVVVSLETGNKYEVANMAEYVNLKAAGYVDEKDAPKGKSGSASGNPQSADEINTSANK